MEQYIDSDYYLIGTDDQGTKSAIRDRKKWRRTMFQQTIDPEFPDMKKSPRKQTQSHYSYMK